MSLFSPEVQSALERRVPMVCPAVAQGHSALLSVPLQSKEIMSSLSCINIRFLHFLQQLETRSNIRKELILGLSAA